MSAEQRVAVVTGASRGIGRAIAQRFHDAGMIVVVASRSGDAACAVAEQMASPQVPAIGCQVDVCREHDVEGMITTTIHRYGRLDVLVNNAGVIRDRLLLSTTEEDWDHVLNTNLRGAFLCLKHAAREMMVRKYGRILNISSIAAHGGGPGQAAYAASKSGLEALMRVAAVELATKGITVNAIAPGVIETDMTGSFLDSETAHSIPVRRVGLPEDVASAALFLCSEDASYVTGQVLPVTGGLGVTYKKSSRR